MVDVETAMGNKRYPAESLQEYIGGNAAPQLTDSTPGGDHWTNVPTPKKASPARVALAYAKSASLEKGALYWAGSDRQYRMRQSEVDPTCPRCDGDLPLFKAVYKRRSGKSDRLLGCKTCLFLIKDTDILNFGAK